MFEGANYFYLYYIILQQKKQMLKARHHQKKKTKKERQNPAKTTNFQVEIWALEFTNRQGCHPLNLTMFYADFSEGSIKKSKN
jgi:hypothetical protein